MKVINFILSIIFLCLFILNFYLIMQDEINCELKGWDGTVTMMGLRTGECYKDNRPNSYENIDFGNGIYQDGDDS